ncbi:MAG: citrate/2-methylcitrate synthase [Candidatus Lernaella stagnicola]|nr:citrate/2-methylcitrate synthase [Candidatus Lernaella stagnicola]
MSDKIIPSEQAEPPEDTVDFRPGLEGVIATRSAISFVDGQKGLLEYRGTPITDLVAHSTFEETCFLLLYNHLPNDRELRQFTTLMAKSRTLPQSVRETIAKFPVGMHPMVALQSGLTLLAGEDYFADEIGSQRHNIRRSIGIIARVPALLAAFDRARNGEEPLPANTKLTHAENFLYMLTGEKPHPVAAEVFDKLLIMHAEHTINASTFTCRVIASTLGNPYSSISGAVGALSGPLHGGANERVLRMLYSIGKPHNVDRFVDEMIETNNKIMGIGHRIYKVKDPRAQLMQEFIPRLLEIQNGEEWRSLYETALKLEEVVTERFAEKKLYPNVDFYSGIVLEMLGVPMDLFTCVFAMARTAGWCAHWVEQVSANRIFRPAQEYIGDHNRPYLPLDRR